MATLVGMELEEIRELIGPDQPAFRARQLYRALYREPADDLASISTLPAELRRRLAADHTLGMPTLERRFDSADGTRRYLLRLADGKTIETVLMPEPGRHTVCISTQVGCPAGCTYCMTALLGLERNLTAGEIVGQLLYVARAGKRGQGSQEGVKKSAKPLPDGRGSVRSRVSRAGYRAARISKRPEGLFLHAFQSPFSRLNVVLMGQGEPLLNLPNVLKATRLLTDLEGVGISPRRITLSTVGIVPAIKELGSASVRPKLAISLGAPSDEIRHRLMPITRRYPLQDLREACRNYPLRPWERLTFEYVLIKGVNDSDADARRLVRLLANLKSKVNLIPLNPDPEIPFQPPGPERVLAFQAIVRRGIPCFIRQARGQDVSAACGQLSRQGQIKEPA
jgi:23S rRNA (adenine2503-C2)-methyltransferase